MNEAKRNVGKIIQDNPPLNILTLASLAEIKARFLEADVDQDAHVFCFKAA